MNKKLEWLQALRAIAALMVVGFHFRELLDGHALLAPGVSRLLQYGFFGVDIFFVLSGFVVALSARRSIGSWRDGGYFLAQRFARIFLGYWPVLLLLYVAMRTMWRAPDPDLAFVSIFLLSPNHAQNWLNVAWSLTYELYFYLLVVAVFLCTPDSKRLSAMVSLAAAILVWNAAWFTAAPHRIVRGDPPGGFFLSALVVEFCAGVILAMLLERRKFAARWMICVGLAALIFGLWAGANDARSVDLSLFRALTYGVAGVGGVLMACAAQSMSLRPSKWLIAIGDASFSLYLLHPIFSLAYRWIKRDGFCGAASVPCEAVALMWPFITVLGAMAWYRALEQPLYAFASEKIQATKRAGARSLGLAG